MALAAARIMAAGNAGLKSIPFFINEFITADIEMLEPLAIDHSTEDADRFKITIAPWMTENGKWRNNSHIFRMSQDFVQMLDSQSLAVFDIVEKVNPLANDAEQRGLADNAATIAAAARTKLDDICRETKELWDDFKALRNSSTDVHLAVVIPYCPEGPTSGTVGMLLGAALRQHFQRENIGDELVVWGIELCAPPNVPRGSKGTGLPEIGNDFRGYVARQELMNGGVPLANDPDHIRVLNRPFDINIVVDGGKIRMRDRAIAFNAIDRSAAQIAAVMLKGPIGDAEETRRMLAAGKRWNSMLVHVTSFRSWHRPTRYRALRAGMPWVNNATAWDADTAYNPENEHQGKPPKARTKAAKRKQQTDERRWLKTVPDRKRDTLNGARHARDLMRCPAVRDNRQTPPPDHQCQGAEQCERDPRLLEQWGKVDRLVTELRGIKTTRGIGGALLPFTYAMRLRRAALVMDRLTKLEKDTFKEVCEDYRQGNRSANSPEGRTNSHFAINVLLPEHLQEENARFLWQQGGPPALATIIGSTGVDAVQQQARQMIEETMQRDRTVNDHSQVYSSAAQYRRIIGVQCYDQDTATRQSGQFRDPQMSPSENNVMYLLAPECQATPGSYTQGVYQGGPLQWRLDEAGKDHLPDQDITADLTFIILAETDPNDGFKDISSYGALEETYLKVTGNRDDWKRYAKYYSGLPPAPLAPPLDAPHQDSAPAPQAAMEPEFV